MTSELRASAAAPRTGALPPPTTRRVAAWVFAAVAVTSAALAFLGLSSTGWWTDELFTLFVIDHRGGAAEVMRRALTDTQPPAYYLLLNAWSRVAGMGEAGLRSLSAILAVSAVGLFWWTTRETFSFAARAWAAAVATTSPFWFLQSQNIRNYALCLVLAAAMLALALRLRRRAADGELPWASWAALTAVGAADAATHFYGLLGFEALLAALAFSLPSWRLRAALAISGLATAAGEFAYIRLLLGRTHENFQHLWFQRDPAHLLGVLYNVWLLGVGGAARLAVLLLLVAWAVCALTRRQRTSTPRPEGAVDARWLAATCAFVLAAAYLGGVAVSLLFAPSLSDRNVLTAAPALWVLLAALYDAGLPRLPPRTGGVIALTAAALTVVHAVAIARGRWLPRNEPWRETARYVAAIPACRGQVLDAVQPDKFGPDTPFYRDLATRWFFGRYLDDGTRVRVHLLAAFTDPSRDPDLMRRIAARSRDPAACPVLAWAVHDVDTRQAQALTAGVARLPGVTAAVRLHTFPNMHFKNDRWVSRPAGYVIERAPPGG